MNQKTASYFGLLTKYKVALLALTLLLTPKFSSAQTSGTLDASFGTSGKATTDFGGPSAARTLAVQADGKILAAGVAFLNGGTDFALARYNSNGTLDTSFGTSGKVTTAFDFPGNFDRVFTVVVQPDGKFVAVGSTVNLYANFALARFNANGTLDASFGTGGIVTTFFGVSAEATSAVVQADGKIVAAGYANLDGGESFALARYNSNGTLDTTFGTGGKVGTAFDSGHGFSYAQASSVAVQPDGRIVAAGNKEIGACLFNGLEQPCFDFALARYNSDGTLDASFGTGGRVTTDFAGPNDQAESVAVQPDGRIVVAGAAGRFINTGFDFAVARYNSNGTLDTSFGTSGKVTTDFAGADDVPTEPSAIALQGDGKIVVVGQTTVGGFYDFVLASFNSNGTLDTSFGTSGKVTTDFAGANDVPFSVAVQPDGNIVLAGGATINGRAAFALARYVGRAVLSTPDIDTAPASLAFGNVTQGSFKDLAVTVRNTGTATLNVTSTTLLGTAEYSIVAGGGAFSLAPAATRQVTVRLTPTSPDSKVATLSFASNDTDENPKNVPLSGMGVAPDIDTAPASLAFGNVTQGSFKNLAVTVRNTGTATLNVTSTTLLGTAEYSIVAGGGAFSLAPAATRQVTVRLTPTSLGSKVATLTFASNDKDENPKNVPLSGTGVAASDLLVSALTGPATAGAGFAITLNETTGNIGVGPAGGTSTRYYLSSDTSIGTGDVLLGGRSLAGLAPGASSAGVTNVTIPAGTANGSYFILAKADDLNQAFESNEGNNTRAIAIRIGPDLRISSLTAPAYTAAGKTISISDTTANLSASSPAEASTTRFFLSTNTTLDAADLVIGSRAVPALASGVSSAATTQVTIPAATVTGTYYILAKVDAANVLAEKSETNNVSSRILRVGPDLVAAVRSITGTPKAGATISVQDLTTNPSAVATPQSTTGYYLSTDNQLDAGDILIGRRTVPALAAGGSSLASAQAVIPVGTPGAYFILAVADYPKVIVESNESNNANAFAITVVP
jgi:uncharacterized delta-60 repeat protein